MSNFARRSVAGFLLAKQVEKQRAKPLRPLNHLYKRDWYWDHEKRLRDAEIAQFGQEEDVHHPDGVHKHQFDPFGR